MKKLRLEAKIKKVVGELNLTHVKVAGMRLFVTRLAGLGVYSA